ncbi:MAG: RIP metalloprotease RseP [Candidatus Spechtbacterales bacterium]
MLVTISIFVIILAILILVHELGHFIVAKRSGAKVEEFGIGFPPRIFSLKRGETMYSINLFPIGGFVKIYGEDGSPRLGEAGGIKHDPRSFASKSIKTRAIIVAAGVLMNIFFAVIILSVGHFIGLPQVLDGESKISNVKNINIRIVDIAEGSPAKEAGIQIGDIIYGMSAALDKITDVKNIEDIQNFTDTHPGEKVAVSVKRGNVVTEKQVIPRSDPPEGEGPIGFAMVRTGQVSYPFYIAPLKGMESTFRFAAATVRAFGSAASELLATGSFGGELAGPVGIAVMTGEAQKLGFAFLLQFIALISINLAIINILPFPALDGGRLLFLGIEKIKGSPVNPKYEKMAHTAGFALLILLMIAITFRDIGKFL